MDDLAAELAVRSLALPLRYVSGMELDLVAPEGTTTETHRPGITIFGPLTWTVLSSLWNVGYPARAEELQEIRASAARAVASRTATDAGGRPPINIRRALALWRVLAATGQIVEELAALTSALMEWQDEGYPRGIECQLGERYLKWDASQDGGIVAVLRRIATPRDAERLLMYPSVDEAAIVLPRDQAEQIARLASMSATAAAGGFTALATLQSPALRRTFVRYKHRITATSPGSAPIWLPHQTHDQWVATDQRFTTGFGVLDWQPRVDHPEIVLWSAGDDDLDGYLAFLGWSFDLLGLILASVVRFADTSVDTLPMLLPPDYEQTQPELTAITALAASDYRQVAIARRHGA